MKELVSREICNKEDLRMGEVVEYGGYRFERQGLGAARAYGARTYGAWSGYVWSKCRMHERATLVQSK